MSVTLRSHQDIANAFSKLGLKPEVLESRKDLDKALDGVKKKDPALVKALEDVVLDGMKGKERERLQSLIGDVQSGKNVPQAGVSVGARVGGGGVMPFRVNLRRCRSEGGGFALSLVLDCLESLGQGNVGLVDLRLQ